MPGNVAVLERPAEVAELNLPESFDLPETLALGGVRIYGVGRDGHERMAYFHDRGLMTRQEVTTNVEYYDLSDHEMRPLDPEETSLATFGRAEEVVVGGPLIARMPRGDDRVRPPRRVLMQRVERATLTPGASYDLGPFAKRDA